MTNSGESMSDVPEFLNVALVTSDDGTCAFLPDTISEQPEDIVDWFDKNEGQMVLSTNCNKPDPLLNQVNARDSPTLLNFSDTEADLGDLCLTILDTPDTDFFDRPTPISKIDKNMNSVSKENKLRLKSISNKCEVLEGIIKNLVTVQVIKHKNKFQLKLRDENGMDVFPTHYIQTKEAGTTQEVLVRQTVKSLVKTNLSTELQVQMPCLHSEYGLRVWLCPHTECRRAFYRFNVAKLHALKHLDHKPFKCSFPNCQWAFFTPFKMKRHEETHSKRKDFACPQANCERRFTTIYNLNWHRRHHHERPATIPCLVSGCDKYFQTVHAREIHLKVHGQNEAPYQCPVLDCKKQFFLFNALTTHARVHTYKLSDLRCQWPNCGRVFEHPCRLKQHTLQHTGQRPFICTYDECKWAFSTASKLKRHLSTHTNERKFHCTMGSCNKSFLRSEHLREHTLTHIGQRQLNCEECSATFAGKSALYLHIKKCHPKSEKVTQTVVEKVKRDVKLDKKPTSDDLLEQAIQSLNVPSDMILGGGLLPEESLELLENENFSTVNLRDLD